jgi:hypothetical protein
VEVLALPSNKSKNDAAGHMLLDLAKMAKDILTLASYVPYHFWNMI